MARWILLTAAILSVLMAAGAGVAGTWSTYFALYDKDEGGGQIDVNDKTYWQQINVECAGYIGSACDIRHRYAWNEDYWTYYTVSKSSYGDVSFQDWDLSNEDGWVYWDWDYGPEYNEDDDGSITQMKLTAESAVAGTYLYAYSFKDTGSGYQPLHDTSKLMFIN